MKFRLLAIATLLLIALSHAQTAFGQNLKRRFHQGERGTLLTWNADNVEQGGPDLNEPLVTDRPDFTEASSTVGRGVAQLEMGYTYFSDNDGTTRTITNSYGEPLLRYGVLANWLEMRVGWNVADEAINGVRNSGTDDLYLGMKIGLTPQAGILPEMAVIPQMTVPTGGSAFTGGSTLGGLNWLYAWDVTDRITTGGSTQFNQAVDGVTSDFYTEWAQSWTIGYSITDRVGAYSEYFGLYPYAATTVKPENYFNGGFTYLLTNNVQFDIRAGVGLNDAADDFFTGAGLTIRIP